MTETVSQEVMDRRLRLLRSSFLTGLAMLFPAVGAVLLANSITLVADLAKSVLELVVKFLSWRVMRRVARGEDPGYNYGLGKLENIVSVAIAGIMLFGVSLVAYHGIHRLMHPAPLEGVAPGMAVVLAMVAVNVHFWVRFKQLAQESDSPLLSSKMRLYRGRALTNACVLFSLVTGYALREWPPGAYIDPVSSLLLCLYLLRGVWVVVSSSFHGLVDKTLEEPLQLQIMKVLAQHFDDYEDITGLRSRRSGEMVFVELYLAFDPDKRMAEVQKAVDRMTRDLEDAIPGSVVTISPRRDRVN